MTTTPEPKWVVRTHSRTVRTYRVPAATLSQAIMKVREILFDGDEIPGDWLSDVDEPDGEEVR